MSDPDDYGDLDVQDTLDRLLTMATIMAMGMMAFEIYDDTERQKAFNMINSAGKAALSNLPPHLKQGLTERLKT